MLETYSLKSRKDLQLNSKAFEYLCVEAEIKNSKKILLNLGDHPSNIDHKDLENYFQSCLSKWKISHTDIMLAEDFNINLLDFDANRKFQNFLILCFVLG